MKINKKNLKPKEKSKSIFELEKELKQKAKELAKNHIDKKPIKYLLK